MKLLTICVPTYNRKEKALKQCGEIIAQCELNELQDEIDILVSDNNSPDCTADYLCSNLQINKKYTTIVRQKRNLGLVGNMFYLYNTAQSEYVWFISDDDILDKNAILWLYKLIKNYKKDFYLLNFSYERKGEIIRKYYWTETNNYLDLITDDNFGGCLLLSCQVLRKDSFKMFYADNSASANLAQPFTITLYGLFNVNGMVDYSKSYLVHHSGDYSWQKYQTRIWSVDLYHSVTDLVDIINEKNFNDIKKSLFQMNQFQVTSGSYILKYRDFSFFKEMIKEGMITKILISSIKHLKKKLKIILGGRNSS